MTSCSVFSHQGGYKKFLFSIVLCVVLAVKHHKEDESYSRSFSSHFSNSFVVLSMSTVCADLKRVNKLKEKKKQILLCSENDLCNISWQKGMTGT